MFSKDIYINRRNQLKKLVDKGIILFLGNTEVPFNYNANTYTFRQDSSFLYFFGIKLPGLAVGIDLDNDKEILFGNDIDIDDIIWMGELPTMKDYAEKAGIKETLPYHKLDSFLEKALKQGRKIHFLPAYRAETKMEFENLLGIPAKNVNKDASEQLIKAVIKLRSIKEQVEVEEIERAVNIAYIMHTTAMKMAKPGTPEQVIYGNMEGIALANGGPVSFPVILSINGQILHNHNHGNILKNGDLLVTDAGYESPMHYCSDITRTTPVGGSFTSRQKEIYQAVLDANLEVIKNAKPGISYKEMHLLSAKIITDRLISIGLMKGNSNDAVSLGAHALFYPHGLGHMLGLDVHDMESLGENNVGYDDTVSRSEQFGLAFLRMAKKLEPGHVITVEPGIYFIPALIDIWKKEKKFSDYINYDKIEAYVKFGGIRIEDDILITDNACRVLGKPIPKAVDEIESLMKNL